METDLNLILKPKTFVSMSQTKSQVFVWFFFSFLSSANNFILNTLKKNAWRKTTSPLSDPRAKHLWKEVSRPGLKCLSDSSIIKESLIKIKKNLKEPARAYPVTLVFNFHFLQIILS